MDKEIKKQLGLRTLEILRQYKCHISEVAKVLNRSEDEIHEIWSWKNDNFFTVEELKKLEEHTKLPISIFVINDLLKDESKQLSKNDRKFYEAAREVLKITREILSDK